MVRQNICKTTFNFFNNIKEKLQPNGKIIFTNLTDTQKDIIKTKSITQLNNLDISLTSESKEDTKYLVLEKINTNISGGYNKIFNTIKKNNILCGLIILLTIILIFALLNIKVFEIIIDYTKYYVLKINNNNLNTNV